jgi:hypothetical protein
MLPAAQSACRSVCRYIVGELLCHAASIPYQYHSSKELSLGLSRRAESRGIKLESIFVLALH